MDLTEARETLGTTRLLDGQQVPLRRNKRVPNTEDWPLWAIKVWKWQARRRVRKLIRRLSKMEELEASGFAGAFLGLVILDLKQILHELE